MIILGIDPAIRTTGYGVIRTESVSRFEILDCGIIANSARLPHTECLRRLAGGIRELVGAFMPDYASIEDPFVGKNASTAIILGMARGAILAALAEAAGDGQQQEKLKAQAELLCAACDLTEELFDREEG